MITKIFHIYGSNGKRVSLVAPEDIKFPGTHVNVFGSYCGAGDGFVNAIVPEKILGIRVSPACFIHDYMWEEAEATWQEFHSSNGIFIRNLIALIRVQSNSKWLKRIRMYRTITYYNFVDSLGADVFWKLKERQGKSGDHNARIN